MTKTQVITTLFLSTLLSSCSTLDTVILGMPLARSITPDTVKNYQSPQELITAKKLNDDKGNTLYGGVYDSSLNQIIMPFKYLSSLCKSKDGLFYKIDGGASDHIGTFRCAGKNLNWYILIEETKVNGSKVNLKTTVVSEDYADQVRTQKEKAIQQKERYLQEQEQLKLAQQKEYQRQILAKAPKKTVIGVTICKEDILSVYTGTMIYGRPTFNKQNGTVIASLEDFSSNSENIKINIKGFLNTSNSISSGADVLYKQTPLESGRVIWDNNKNWFKCNF